MSNSFGTLFRITTFGESHGEGIGVVIDGCPPRIEITEETIQKELNRRRPGQSPMTTPRQELDKVTIFSGTYNNKTLGTPLTILIKNQDMRPEDYSEMKDKFRPSHADFTYQEKYGIRAIEGGGRASARETVARVAAGAIAKKILQDTHNIEIRAYTESIHKITCPILDYFPTLEDVEHNDVRCPHEETAEKMIQLIKETLEAGDSLGGKILCRIRNVPVGLGAPVFDRLEADLAKAMLSIPATKGFEIGSGFQGTTLKGSEHNDIFENRDGKIRTRTNFSGGVQGGISNGEEVYFRIAFKPTSTIYKAQKTTDIYGNETIIQGKGRHDPCVLPRAVPIVEGMAALVLLDHLMWNIAQNHF